MKRGVYPAHWVTVLSEVVACQREEADSWDSLHSSQLSALLPRNSIIINEEDADRLGPKSDDLARITSASNHDAAGLHTNAAMRVDPVLKHTCLVDVTGGSAVFYDTRVTLVKA